MHFVKTAALATNLIDLIECTLTGAQIAHHFSSTLSPGTGVYLPSDANYSQEVEPRWQVYNPPTYVVAVKPALPTDISKVIRYAQKHGIPFLGTGGGHGYSTTLGNLQNGIDIDLGNFKTVSVDAVADTMTIGGSVHFANVTGVLQAAGKEIPVGSCSCIGMLGATLGGGLGPYSSLHGPISDSLLSVEMITGTGEVLTVSEHTKPDLFWAVKGAGFNYGIVTSATYKVYNATNGGMAMSADMLFPGTANGSIWSFMSSFVGNQPKEMTFQAGATYNSTLDQMLLIVNVIYAGPLKDGMNIIKPLLDLKPLVQNVSYYEYKYIEDYSIFGATVKGCVKGHLYSEYATNLYQMNVNNLVDVFNFMNKSMSTTPSLQESILAFTQFSSYGLQLHEQESSSYPFRDLVTLVELDGLIPTQADGPAVTAFGKTIQTMLQRQSGSSTLQVYVNYAHGDEGPDAWYTPANLPRLKALKQRYDPHGLFNYYNSVGSTKS